ncbi:MAG: magnesium transporter CorA family protein [Lentisphaerae bacterium]|nr:magnesium transporter CorA family protein [Lentisphaerota bacterium]
MFKSYKISDGRVVECPEDVIGPIQLYSNPTDDDRKFLVEECGIDEHTYYSALDEDEISRVEYEANHIAVIMKQPRRYNRDNKLIFRVASAGAFLFKDKIIIVQADSVPIFEYGKMPLRGNTIPGVLLRLVYHATRHFLENLRIIRSISDSFENKMETSVTNKALAGIFSLLKGLTYYESATGANQLLLLKLKADARKIGFTEEEIDFLEDITVENKQCDNLSNIYSEILTDMSGARVSIVNNNLSNVMKYLTVINLVFMPINVLTGIGGMSEFTMMTEGIWWPYAYSGFFLAAVLIAYITFLVVKRIGMSPQHK